MKRSPHSPLWVRCALPVLAEAEHGDTQGQPGQELPFTAPGAAGPGAAQRPHRSAPQQRRAGGTGRRGARLPSRRHSSCCHRSCLLERGGRRSGEPGRAPGPAGRGAAAWCRAAGSLRSSGVRPLSSTTLRGDRPGLPRWLRPGACPVSPRHTALWGPQGCVQGVLVPQRGAALWNGLPACRPLILAPRCRDHVLRGRRQLQPCSDMDGKQAPVPAPTARPAHGHSGIGGAQRHPLPSCAWGRQRDEGCF